MSSAGLGTAGARGQAPGAARHLRGDAPPPDAHRRGLRHLRHLLQVQPALRTAADVAALCEALADGTVDAIATDHAPHSPVEKDVEFENAAFGMTGLETAPWPCAWTWSAGGCCRPPALVSLLTHRPAALLGLPGGTLAPGSPADVTVIRPEARLDLRPGARLRSRNTVEEHALRGRSAPLRGKVVLTLVGRERIVDQGGDARWTERHAPACRRRCSRWRTAPCSAAWASGPPPTWRGRDWCSTPRSPATRRC